MNAPDILVRILAEKRRHVSASVHTRPLAMLREVIPSLGAPRGFEAALRRRAAHGHSAVIAEIKKASPSKGLLCAAFVPAAIAAQYEAAGATALSVLTDTPFFEGRDQDLVAARAAVALPVLRKDFVVDPYQVFEARALGADAILLIVAALSDTALAELFGCARSLALDVLVEVHDSDELARAAALGATLIGINNRDLRSFETRLETTLELAGKAPASAFLVTESGIATRTDVARVRKAGIAGFLVGETLMRAPDPGDALTQLFGEESA